MIPCMSDLVEYEMQKGNSKRNSEPVEIKPSWPYNLAASCGLVCVKAIYIRGRDIFGKKLKPKSYMM